MLRRAVLDNCVEEKVEEVLVVVVDHEVPVESCPQVRAQLCQWLATVNLDSRSWFLGFLEDGLGLFGFITMTLEFCRNLRIIMEEASAVLVVPDLLRESLKADLFKSFALSSELLVRVDFAVSDFRGVHTCQPDELVKGLPLLQGHLLLLLFVAQEGLVVKGLVVDASVREAFQVVVVAVRVIRFGGVVDNLALGAFLLSLTLEVV